MQILEDIKFEKRRKVDGADAKPLVLMRVSYEGRLVEVGDLTAEELIPQSEVLFVERCDGDWFTSAR